MLKTALGNGRNPGMSELLGVAKAVGFNNRKAKSVAEDIRECVQERLGKYLL